MKSDSVFETVLDYIREGMTISDACGLAGIGRTTFYEWRNTLPRYQERIEAAQIECKKKMVDIVRKGATNDPRLACWWLERKYPNEYGKEMIPVIPLDRTSEEIARIRQQYAIVAGISEAQLMEGAEADQNGNRDDIGQENDK